MAKAASTRLLVAAIDFGTAYSGSAYSFCYQFEQDPTNVTAKQWNGGSLVSQKGPTCVLLETVGEEVALKSFGYEAESEYAELMDNGEHGDYFFFRRFKMMLFDKIKMDRHIVLEDVTGKTLPALTVFRLAIEYLKNDLMGTSRKTIADGGIEETDVYWVITVPAIWSDVAKQFMRLAAEQAGIASERLTLALEPEVASLYCRHLRLQKAIKKSGTVMETFKPGTKYVVLDAGGGTVDVTVHQLLENGEIKELYKASGGPWGGTCVDEAFIQFLIKLVGEPVMKAFRDKHVEDYTDMLRNFELKKRIIRMEKTGQMTVDVPGTLIELFEKMTEKKLQDVIPPTSYAGKLSLQGVKIKMDVDIAKEFFRPATKNIIAHLKDLLKQPNVCDCTCILMVGGFSESSMLETSVKAAFPNMTVIVPQDAGLAVLKGAVIFGHNPDAVVERVCRYTYGISVRIPFKEGVHPADKKEIVGGEFFCMDLFDVLVPSGLALRLGEVQAKETYTPYDTDGMRIMLYASPEINPRFVTDPRCQLIGDFNVYKDKDHVADQFSVEVQMTFGGTEMQVLATDELTGKLCLQGDRIKMDADIAKEFFRPATKNIIAHLKDLLKQPHVFDCTCILMVGGFSESSMLETSVKAAFPNMTVIVPQEAGLAVLKGAVIFGHNPDAVVERVCRYTYGIKIKEPFREGVHPDDKREIVGGNLKCKDVFSVLVPYGLALRL